ncbi:CCA tRNA nucleotidyltransferase [Solibacillus sp. CAU 1738]|uniref:CCA tRNA nucleotidyltransferase n=1 Tax=Solibacillus sp. CAU 1738 TaxID=3140363 RepID=UPI00326031BB
MKNDIAWQVAGRVIEKIEQAGFEAVFVGGAVRDLFIGKMNNDVDVATNALPLEVKAIFSNTIDVGIEHGTVLVLDEGEPIEVTTYRTDGEYTDHRRPNEVKFVRSLAEDLARRDFTMNAMALTRQGETIDLYGGKADIKSKLIRAVGNPLQRFEEDALRMMRAVRFSAQLGFSIETQTKQAAKQLAEQIQFVAKERIHAELDKMWMSQSISQGMTMLNETGLVQYLLGSFHPHQWHNFQANNPFVGWAYLNLISNDDKLLSYYKCSNKEKAFAKQVKQAYNKLQVGWDVLDYFQYDIEVLQTAYDFTCWQGDKLDFDKKQIAEKKSALPIANVHQLVVNGNHFMRWTEKKRGPWIKEVLDAALLAVLTGEVVNEKERLKEWFHDYDKR